MSHAMLPLPSLRKCIAVINFADLYPYREGSMRRNGAPCLSGSGLPAISSASNTRGESRSCIEKYSYHLSAQSMRTAFAELFGFANSSSSWNRNPPQVVRADQHCTHFMRESCMSRGNL